MHHQLNIYSLDEWTVDQMCDLFLEILEELLFGYLPPMYVSGIVQ